MGSKWSFQPNIPLPCKNLRQDRTYWNSLSNELVFEIFDYLSFTDIYLSFGGLNIRFNTLIESYPHHVNLQSSQLLPHHIRSLKITQKCQLPLFFSLHQTPLSSVCAISLSNLRLDHIYDVLKRIELKQLQYIYLGVCTTDGDTTKRVMTDVQRRILTLGQYQLKRCHLKDNLFVDFNDLPETLSSLNYLQVVGCENFYILSQFLSRMPNLRYIQASIKNQTEFIPLTCSNGITHLILRPHSNCSGKELNIFLKNCCSSLEKLVIEFQTYKGEQCNIKCNKYEWLTMFPHQLKYFHLKMLPHPWDHATNMTDLQKLPLREKILLNFSNYKEHYCQVIIDTLFINIWQKI